MDTKDKDFKERATRIKAEVNDDEFMQPKKDIVHLFSTICETITKMQRDAPMLSAAYPQYQINKEHMKEVLFVKFDGIKSKIKKTLSQKDWGSREESVAKVVMELFEERWTYLFEDAMMASFHLDPRSHLPEKPFLPPGSISRIKSFILTLVPESEKNQLSSEYQKFRVYEDPFHDETFVWTKDEVRNPRAWWLEHGSPTPILQRIAVILLYVFACISCCSGAQF